MICSKQDCKKPAVSFLVNARSQKLCVLKDLAEENPHYSAMVFCKLHTNQFKQPVGWELRREIRDFFEQEIEREIQMNLTTSNIPVVKHPTNAKNRFPDDDLTRIMNIVKKPKIRPIPEHLQGARRGNLVAVRIEGE